MVDAVSGSTRVDTLAREAESGLLGEIVGSTVLTVTFTSVDALRMTDSMGGTSLSVTEGRRTSCSCGGWPSITRRLGLIKPSSVL